MFLGTNWGCKGSHSAIVEVFDIAELRYLGVEERSYMWRVGEENGGGDCKMDV